MHRIERARLEATIFVILKRASKAVQRDLSSRSVADSDRAADAITKLIVDQLDNMSTMVIQAQERPGTYELRQWGIDEPDPTAP